MPTSLEVLTQINLDDLVSSFGWQNQPWLARLLRRTFIKPARIFASQMADFDSPVATHGLAEASRLALRHYVRDIRIFGANRIPAGAFLALSNHPGMSDTLSLFVALKRPDLKIIAFNRPFLNALPNVSRQLLYLTDDPASRITLVRQMSTHLRKGGAALTFPSGHIEPDPDVHDGALDSLGTWTNSAGVFMRMAPETAILPILVRGVVWKKTAFHPLTYLKRTRGEREKLAGALQLLAYAMWKVKPVTVRVQIGRPIYAKALGTVETQVIHQAVLAEMKQMIANLPEGQGESAI
ncbi:MAG: lysophospholipid acyltransferase family protein [Anaerolineales bacterium]